MLSMSDIVSYGWMWRKRHKERIVLGTNADDRLGENEGASVNEAELEVEDEDASRWRCQLTIETEDD
jgi:hypothetical protein